MTSRNPLPRVALATSSGYPELWVDDAPLRAALADAGVAAEPVVWDDPSADWPSYGVVVIRSTWDYTERRADFVAWADRVGRVTRLRNPAGVVRWNTDKTYLRSLAARGVPVVPTVWSAAGLPVDVAATVAEQGWADAVVKPTVSAGARRTLRFGAGEIAAAQALAAEIARDGDGVMVQPYLGSVEEHGERSLIFVAGEFSHAVRREPSLVPGSIGGHEAGPVAAEPDELAVAEQVLRVVGEPLLYARVDLVRDGSGTPVLIELEAVEPQLFLRHAPVAAHRLAAAITTEAAAGSGGSAGRP